MINITRSISAIVKRFVISVVTCISVLHLHAQSINPRVVGSSGGTGSSAEATISWTIGEPVITTLVQPSGILSQGFHQSFGATATISVDPANATVCDGDAVELRVDFTGSGPWSFTYTDGTTSWLHSGVTDNPYIFDTDVAPVWTGPGTSNVITYTIAWVSQNGFMTPGSGSAVVTVFKRPATGPMYHIPNLAGVMDIDGNFYEAIEIGTQTWMASNLKTTRYNDGDPIDYPGSDNGTWSTNNTGAYAWYNNDQATYSTPYGALYNWHAVNTGKLCPVGWHVPTGAEWDTMRDYLIANGYNYDGTTTGNKIAKAIASLTLWSASATEGVPGNTDYPAYRNKSGFNGFPSGQRANTGGYSAIGANGIWWTATFSVNANLRRIYNSQILLNSQVLSANYGYSVRCIKD